MRAVQLSLAAKGARGRQLEAYPHNNEAEGETWREVGV